MNILIIPAKKIHHQHLRAKRIRDNAYGLARVRSSETMKELDAL